MKNNYMIGDWVATTAYGNGMVCGLFEGRVKVFNPVADEESEMWLDKTSPIEMDIDVLKYSGFTRDDEGYWCADDVKVNKCAKGFSFKYKDDDALIIKAFKYVHELQDLLRIVGKSNLAGAIAI